MDKLTVDKFVDAVDRLNEAVDKLVAVISGDKNKNADNESSMDFAARRSESLKRLLEDDATVT